MIRDLRRHVGGFTILETIIVLTVTVALLGSALLVFQGRVPRVQFESAVNEMSTQIQDVANQVASGNYPYTGNFKCSAASGTPELGLGNDDQGTNEDCVFIGQAIQFGVSCTAGNDDCDDLHLYTVVGLRATPSGIVMNLDAAKPQISHEFASTSQTLSYGMSVSKVLFTDGAGTHEIGGVGFFQTFGRTVSGPDQLNGASQVEVVPLKASGFGQAEAQFASILNSMPVSSNEGFYTTPNPASGITICLRSGGSNQWGTITLARNGAVFDIDRVIHDTEPTECA